MNKKKNKRINVVYSTNSDFRFEYDEDSKQDTLPPNEQLLYVSHDRKQRNGKSVTLVHGFVGSENDLNLLARQLKSKCGVGGTVKENEILIQGEHCIKVLQLLQKEGFKVKRKGG